MINEELTFQRFGYRSTDLKPQSNRKVIATCDKCGKIREVHKFQCPPLCRSCKVQETGHANRGKKRESKYEGILTEKFLRERYIEEGLSSSEIGKIVGCCSPTILNFLKKFHIPTRVSSFDGSTLTRELLVELYEVNLLTMKQVAEIVGCKEGTISDYLHKFNIHMRKGGIASFNMKWIKILTPEFLIENLINKKLSSVELAEKIGCSPGRIDRCRFAFKIKLPPKKNKWDHILTKPYLIEEYVEKVLSTPEIAEKVGCNVDTVNSRLRKYEIEIRRRGHRRLNKNYAPVGKGKLFTPEFLFENYITRGLSSTDIGKIKGCPDYVVIYYLEKWKIPIRSAEENHATENYKKKTSGENSIHWKGGPSSLYEAIRSLYEYGEWRIACLERDGFTCRDCGSQEESLHVHHTSKFFIDLLREFTQLYSEYSPEEDIEKLVEFAKVYRPFWNTDNGKTLCHDCHIKEHTKEKKINASAV